jgi:hypothetical protein
MHGLVINIRAQGRCDVVAIALRLSDLTEMLLFIGDEVLGARHYTLTLNALDGGTDQGSGQIGVGTKTFLQRSQYRVWFRTSRTDPVATSFRRATQWTADRTKRNIDTFLPVLGTDGLTPLSRKISTPRGRNVHTGWKRGDVIG